MRWREGMQEGRRKWYWMLLSCPSTHSLLRLEKLACLPTRINLSFSFSSFHPRILTWKENSESFHFVRLVFCHCVLRYCARQTEA